MVYEKSICYYNNRKYNITDEFKEEIVRIIRTWKNEYGSSNIIDDEEFRVIVTSTNKEEFHGKGIFPKNYRRLIELIGDIDGNSR